MLTDQNLLFGVLALQLEFVDTQQLAEACSVWAACKEIPLSDVMVSRGWISEQEKGEVLRLLERKVGRQEGDVHQTLTAVAGANVRDIIRSVGDQDIDATLSQLGPGPGFVQISGSVEASSGERSHFTLSRVHDEGGLGRVWVAYDRNLCRDVALKEIRPDRRPGKLSLQRFVQEAQITGQLEHPNIVPVYELGRDSDREYPFYTMRFVRGKSLSAEIEEHHQNRLSDSSRVLNFRRLLDSFVSVCNAIGYAHSKGVIHRDLKPANVMVGDYGEVVVLDWGLAKIMDKTADETEDAVPIQVHDDDNAADTQTGQALGTPAYMAPEQAAGRRAEINSLTDVYGLGAILYRILTGERPRTGRNSKETLQRAIEDPTPEPRVVNPEVPRGLNAICAKAMAKNQADRYPSALALANDVQRWLADEPIAAYPDPWHLRMARWARKHKTTTVAAGIILAVVTLVASTASVLIHRAGRETEVARREAVDAWEKSEKARIAEAQAKDAARRRLDQSMSLIDRMATSVSDWARFFPGSSQLREALLEAAASRYQIFADEEHDDPKIRCKSVDAQIRLGDVYVLMGRPKEAAEAFRLADTKLEQLADVASPETDLRELRASCIRKLGDALCDQRKHEEAENAFRRAEDLLNEVPPSPGRQRQRAELFLHRALLEDIRGNTDLSLKWLEKAKAELPEEPTDPQLAELAAQIQSVRGKVLVAAGENRAAVLPLSEVLRTYNDLVEKEDDYPPYVEGLAYAEFNLAWAFRLLGRQEDEGELLQSAIANYQALIDALTNVPHLRENRAAALTQYALVLHLTRRNREAVEQVEEAMAEFTRLRNSPGAVPRYWDGLAQAGIVLGRILRDLDQYEDSERNLRSSINAYVTQLMPDEEDTDPYQLAVAVAGRHLGRLMHRQDRIKEAEDEYSNTVEQLKKLLEKDDRDLDVLDELACCYEYWGDLYAGSQAAERARELYTEAIQYRASLPPYPSYMARHAGLLLKIGSQDSLDKATELTTALRKEVPDNTAYQFLQGLVYYRSGDAAQCIQVLKEREDENLDLPGPEYFFLLAMACRERNRPDDARDAQRYLERAIAWMDSESPGDLDLVGLRNEAGRQLAEEQDESVEAPAKE